MIIEHGILNRGFHPAASVQDAVASARGGSGVAWIGVQDPDEGDVEPILQALGHHRLLQLGRRRGHAGLTGLRDHLFVTLIEVEEAGSDRAPTALEALGGASHLVVVLHGGDAGDAARLRRHVEERLADLSASRQPSGWLALAALLLVYFGRYDRALDAIEDRVRAINSRLFPAPDDAIIEDIYLVNERVARVGRAVRPLAHGLVEASSDERFAGDAEARRAILRLHTVAEDLAGRVAWAEQTLTSLTNTVLGLTAQRTNELAARQSAIAQKISAYALLFAIPNAVFALYGTNFQHLPRILTRDYGYPVLLAFTAVLMVFVAWRLRRSGWL